MSAASLCARPQSAANDASLRSRSMFCPAVVSSVPAWPVDNAMRDVVAGVAAWTSCLSWRPSVSISASGRPADAQLVREHGWSYDQCEHWITATLTATLLA